MTNDRKTYVEINLTNLTYNVQSVINQFYKFDYYIAVVKSDCYGHNDIKSVQAIIDGGCNYLAVATLDEALYIREYIKDIPILCLGVVSKENVNVAIANNITLTINSIETLNDYLQINHDNLKVHIKINTGANRLGVKTSYELKKIIDLITESNMILEGIFTHIYNAYNKEDTLEQFSLFDELTKDIDIMNIPIRHIQASDALYGYEKPKNANGCRLGIIMYGLIENELDLKSTFTLYSEIIQLHKIKKGENVGYEGIYHAKDDEIIAVVCIGYADGIIRKNTGRNVFINEKEYPIIGNICMDLLFVKVDDSVKLHDKVVILKDNEHINNVAKHLETISYEIICSIGKRVPRKYIK